jgi:hypothetical protein
MTLVSPAGCGSACPPSLGFLPFQTSESAVKEAYPISIPVPFIHPSGPSLRAKIEPGKFA